MIKLADDAQLVTARKACHLCSGLTNPADVDGGRLNSEHIGAWSLWQGNLDAPVMVVGQDWGDTTYFIRNGGEKAHAIRRTWLWQSRHEEPVLR